MQQKIWNSRFPVTLYNQARWGPVHRTNGKHVQNKASGQEQIDNLSVEPYARATITGDKTIIVFTEKIAVTYTHLTLPTNREVRLSGYAQECTKIHGIQSHASIKGDENGYMSTQALNRARNRCSTNTEIV